MKPLRLPFIRCVQVALAWFVVTEFILSPPTREVFAKVHAFSPPLTARTERVKPSLRSRYFVSFHANLPDSQRKYVSTTAMSATPATAGSLSISTAIGSLDALLYFPVFWSVCIMLTIVGLLVAWEEAIEFLRENTPPTIQPTIDKVLGEIGGLGFIGLVLSTFVLNQQLGLGNAVGGLSETYLGDEEILLESFEFLHEVFFQTAVCFFLATAVVITGIVSQIESITAIVEQEASSMEGGEGPCPMEAYEAFLPKCDSTQSQSNASNDVIWKRELGLTEEERGAEILVIRERLKREGMATESGFTIVSYLEDLFSSDKLEFVDLSPLSWVPLIPGIALLNAVDLEHDVLPNSINNYESCGYFVSTPWVILPIFLSQILCLTWSVYNFSKMASIKAMLVPKLVAKENTNVRSEESKNFAFEIIRPDVEVPELRREFSELSSNSIFFGRIESFFGETPTNRVQELFGTVGGNGVEYFLNSIKFQLWLTVTSLTCLGFYILPRDILAIRENLAGNPDSLVPELLVFGSFCALNALELLVVPSTFLNYCLISTVETFVDRQEKEKEPFIIL